MIHHEFALGDIIVQMQFINIKFESFARKRAQELLVSLTRIIDAFKQGYHSLYEMAIFFEILESFEQQCLERYKIKYDLSTLCGDYLIQFSPLRVFEYKNLENGRNVE